jgi:DNA processing protein
MTNPDRSELLYRIALTMAQQIGPVTARKLILAAGSARAVFELDKRSLEKIEGIGPRATGALDLPALITDAQQEMEFAAKHNIGILSFDDPGYPRRLEQCRDAPILLFTRGEQDLNPARCLSVVGTRMASPYGSDMCRELVRGLAGLLPGLVIVSGLAFGIDGIAHRAALRWGLPTVAVLGHGLHTIYPVNHTNLAGTIIQQGALVTDFDSGTGPERNNFIRRNRIIAGLTDGTLVVESAEKGGALITAHIAFSYDRQVMSVPGRADDPRSKGCNRLIKGNVAAMVESPGDIIRLLNWDTAGSHRAEPVAVPELLPEERRFMDLIGENPGITPGMLSAQTGTPVQEVTALLLGMELRDLVSRGPGNRYRLLADLTG